MDNLNMKDLSQIESEMLLLTETFLSYLKDKRKISTSERYEFSEMLTKGINKIIND